jgi:predicted exporter
MPISGFLSSPRLSAAWAVLLFAALLTVVVGVSGRDWLHTSVFELLPAARDEPMVADAAARIRAAAAARMVFVTSHPEPAQAAAAADRLAAGLRRHPAIASATARIDPAESAGYAAFYRRHHRQMLTARQIAAIRADDGASVAQAALAALYGPIGTGRAGLLESDPFFLLADSLQERGATGRAFTLHDGRLTARLDGTTWVMVSAELSAPVVKPREQQALIRHVELLQSELLQQTPGASMLRTGFLFYAGAGTASAQRDVARIGTGSLLGILALFLLTFRSVTPLMLALLSTGAGIVTGLAATLAVFGSVHLFTLAFGAGLIGVAVDYTFHYTTEAAFGRAADPAEVLQRILPGIGLGCLTSMVAYGALASSPFPGLQQVAVFSSAGLAAAGLTVVAAFRLWRIRRRDDRRPLLAKLSEAWLRLTARLSTRVRWLMLAAAALLGVAAVGQVAFDDDIRVLQARPASLEADEAAIAALSGPMPGGSFVLVRGETPEQVLQREEALRATLDEMIADDALSGYLAVSRWVPSRRAQQESVAAYRQLLAARLPQFFSDIGMPKERAQAVLRAQTTGPVEPLEIGDWLASPVSRELRFLWSGPQHGGYASAVAVQGVTDAAAIDRLTQAVPHLDYVDQARELTGVFAAYRAGIAWVLAIAAGAALLMFSLYAGPLRALAILSAPVIAALLALGVLAAAGATLTVFNLVALFLVLGVGVDFSLFLATTRGDQAVTMLAITLSMLTTLLSFGLLSLSGTHAISSFGMTVLVGIALCYLLAPLAVAGAAPGRPS